MNPLDVNLLAVHKILDDCVNAIFCSLSCVELTRARSANLFTYQSQDPCQNFSRTLPNPVSIPLRSMYPNCFFERLIHPLNKYLSRRRKNYKGEILRAILDEVLDGFTLLFFSLFFISLFLEPIKK